MDELGNWRFLCKACDDFAAALPISFDDPILSLDSESVVGPCRGMTDGGLGLILKSAE